MMQVKKKLLPPFETQNRAVDCAPSLEIQPDSKQWKQMMRETFPEKKRKEKKKKKVFYPQ